MVADHQGGEYPAGVSFPRHCERSEAISVIDAGARLLRFARNDEVILYQK
jgi:hypothetical protein